MKTKFIDLGLPSGILWADRNVGANRQTDTGIYISYPKFFFSEDEKLPSMEDFDELIRFCTWKWTKQNGINGYKVIGVNKKHIFLPAVGYFGSTTLIGSGGAFGYYWSSKYYDSSYAYSLRFYSSYVYVNLSGRLVGMSVRLIKKK